jgi:hypothetical protein
MGRVPYIQILLYIGCEVVSIITSVSRAVGTQARRTHQLFRMAKLSDYPKGLLKFCFYLGWRCRG